MGHSPAKKYVVSSALDRVDWNAELVRGDLRKAVQQLKRESGKGLFVDRACEPESAASRSNSARRSYVPTNLTIC
jgi:hypothetical protein